MKSNSPPKGVQPSELRGETMLLEQAIADTICLVLPGSRFLQLILPTWDPKGIKQALLQISCWLELVSCRHQKVFCPNRRETSSTVQIGIVSIAQQAALQRLSFA